MIDVVHVSAVNIFRRALSSLTPLSPPVNFFAFTRDTNDVATIFSFLLVPLPLSACNKTVICVPVYAPPFEVA